MCHECATVVFLYTKMLPYEHIHPIYADMCGMQHPQYCRTVRLILEYFPTIQYAS